MPVQPRTIWCIARIVTPGPPVQRVAAREAYPLRHRVLRSHQGIADVAFPGDDDPETGHFAAFTTGPAPEIIGVVTVLHQSPTTGPDAATWWRLRGMATADEHRGRGVGTALVSAALGHVASHGGTVVWCNARMAAVAFYRKVGFVTTGDAWDEPVLGSHIAMWRTVHPT